MGVLVDFPIVQVPVNLSVRSPTGALGVTFSVFLLGKPPPLLTANPDVVGTTSTVCTYL